MKRPVAMSLAVVWLTLAGCGHSQAQAPAPGPSAETAIGPSGSADRLPPPEVPPVERNGVRYLQAPDGRKAGQDQEHGVLVAVDPASGKQLWSLVVYPNVPRPDLEEDAQWIFFSAMSFDADGRLRIENEAGKIFLVDVNTRTVTAADGG
jgi:hypothetical protein